MIRNDSDSNGGDEQTTEQATLGEAVPDFDGVEQTREINWKAGMIAGGKALIILSIALWGLFHLMATDTLHIAFASSVAVSLLLEMLNFTKFLGEF